jgi:hypothetical protein
MRPGAGRVAKRARSSYGNGFQNLVQTIPYAGNTAVAAYNSFKTNARGASAGGQNRNPFLGGRRPKVFGGTTGKYAGRFSKVRKYRLTLKDKLLKKGYGIVTETKGQCTGQNSVYLGVTTLYLDAVCNAVSVAVLRRLFKKCGYDISDPQANLELSNNSDSSSVNFRLVRKMEDGDGTTTNDTYDFVAAETLYSLVVNSGFASRIKNYAQGSNTNICVKVYLARAVGDAWIQLGSLELVNELIDLQMSTKVSIQNRTQAAAGGSDIDRVDNQPLVGRSYKFESSTPIVNHVGNIGAAPDMTSLFEKWTDNKGGVHLISDNSAGFDSVLQKLPSPVYFNNCKKAGGLKLEPGEIKDMYVSNKYTMYFGNFVKKLSWINSPTNSNTRSQKVGDCILFGFEERMDSGSAFNITLAYEAQNNVTASCRVGRTTAMKEAYVRLDYTV